jgi:hypothetical protein
MQENVRNILLSGNIVQFIGLGYFILGMAVISGVQVDSIYLLCLSLTALFFSFADLALSKLKESNDDRKKKSLLRKILPNRSTIIFLMHILACFFMIYFPHLPYLRSLSKETLANLGNSSTLMSLGISIFLIGDRSIKSLIGYIEGWSGLIIETMPRWDGIEDKLKSLEEKNKQLVEELQKRDIEIEELRKKLM